MTGGKNGRHLSCRVTHILVIVTHGARTDPYSQISWALKMVDVYTHSLAIRICHKNEMMVLYWCPHQCRLNYDETWAMKITEDMRGWRGNLR